MFNMFSAFLLLFVLTFFSFGIFVFVFICCFYVYILGAINLYVLVHVFRYLNGQYNVPFQPYKR